MALGERLSRGTLGHRKSTEIKILDFAIATFSVQRTVSLFAYSVRVGGGALVQ